MPFFVDLCTEVKGEVEASKTCQIDAYKDFAFAQQEKVLDETDMNKDDFVKQWS